jgi:hypothetical protein
MGPICKNRYYVFLVLILFFTVFFLAENIKYASSAGIIGSPHDFTINGLNGGSDKNYLDGVCRACHTPHKKNDIRLYPSIPSVPPRWENEWNSVRRLCLDCHGYDSIPSPDLPTLSGVTWGATGTTPPKITDADGTKTLGGPYAADSHTGQERCTSCHSHVSGFSKCGSCHGFPPADQQHKTHVTDYGFDCYTCHYKFNDMAVNPNEHPSQVFLNTGEMGPIFVKMPPELEDAPYYFPGGTMITNGSFVPILQMGGEVTCDVGCHNPVIAMPDSIPRQRDITVKWQADVNNVTCINCHDDISDKFTDPSTHSSKHPADPAGSADCLICHSFIKPIDKITINDNGSDVEVYHTNYKLMSGTLPSWPQVTYTLLLDRDDSSIIPYKLNVSEFAGAYSYTGDYSYENNITTFCVDCHDGDDSVDPVFSLGGGAPNIEQSTFWANSAHATGGRSGIKVGCFGDATMNSGTGCHGNAHGSKKINLLGPADTAAAEPDFEDEEEGFCYVCHQSGGVVNYALSTKSDLSYTLADNIKDAFTYTSTHPVKDSEQPIVNNVQVEVECVSCHSVHWATGKYSESVDNKTSVTLPKKLAAFRAGTALTDSELLWGDETGEKATDYAAQYIGTGGQYVARQPSDGWCWDTLVDEPAVYLPIDGYGESTEAPDYTTFCLDCHNDPNMVVAPYLFDNAVGGTLRNPWQTGDAHGGLIAGAGSDPCNYPTDYNPTDPRRVSCSWVDEDGEPLGFGYPKWIREPYSQKDRVGGINYVLTCTDCHEAHGSTRADLNKTAINNNSGGGNICGKCHMTYGMPHLYSGGGSMGCGPSSCHSTYSVHYMTHRGGGGVNGINLGPYFFHGPPGCDNIEEGLLVWWDMDETVTGSDLIDRCNGPAETPYCDLNLGLKSCRSYGGEFNPSGAGNNGCDNTGDNAVNIINLNEPERWSGTLYELYPNTTTTWPYSTNKKYLNLREEITIEAWINPDIPYSTHNLMRWLVWNYCTFRGCDKHYGVFLKRDGYLPEDRDVLYFAAFVSDVTTNTFLANMGHPKTAQFSGVGTDTGSLYRAIYVRTGDPGFEGVQITNNSWQHISCTFDGYYMRIYVNGVLAGETEVGSWCADGRCEIKNWGWGTSRFYVGSGWVHIKNPCNSADGRAKGNYLGEMDDVKIYQRAKTPEEISCTVCHNAFPPNDGSHLTHKASEYGPKATCDDCHGTGASNGTHMGHMDCDMAQIDFADGADLANTTVCDECHGNDPLKGEASESFMAKTYWRVDGSTPLLWINESGYCEGCHDATPSTVNTVAATGGVDVTAQNEDGDYNPIDYSGTYGFRVNGHGTPITIELDCTTCHDPDGPHIDSNGDVKLRLVNDPDTGLPYDPDSDDKNCSRCHDGVLATMASTHSNIDNPAEGGFIKYEEDFGYVRCIDCHNPHGTTNIKMINSEVKKRDIAGNITALLPITFTSQTGLDSFDEGNELIGVPDDNDDLCVVCHIDSGMAHHIGGKHESLISNDCDCIEQDRRDDKCTDCHVHELDSDYLTQDGFMPKPPDYRDDCLYCHTFPSSLSIYDVDGQFDGIGSISDDLIMSQHLVKYVGPDYSSRYNNECKKCHGETHPRRDATVVNVDDDVTTYSSSDCGGRTPDDLSPFCFSCHDGVADTGIISDIQFNGTLPPLQIAPRGQESKPITDPWLPPYVNSDSYYTRGIGSSISLSGRETGPNMKCTDCHEYHSSDANRRLAKSFLGGSEGTVSFNYDDETSDSYDNWCTYTCHFSLEPSVIDHTAGESRDGTTEPEGFLPTHPTSIAIPADPLVKQYSQIDPMIQKYINSNTTIICISCHDPHGADPSGEASDDKQMLRLKWSESGITDGLCAACHN